MSKLILENKKRGVGIGGPNVIGTKTKEPQGILNKILRTAPVNTPRWASYGKPCGVLRKPPGNLKEILRFPRRIPEGILRITSRTS